MSMVKRPVLPTLGSSGQAMRPRRPSLHQQIVEDVRTRLLDGSIPPGTRIPETALCGELDISRTPLREALKVLASEGLVELLPHRGAIATDVSVEETQDVFDVLVILERRIGELAAAAADEDTVDFIEGLHLRMLEFHQRRRRADYFRLNQQIHVALSELAGNDVLSDVYFALMQRAMRARFLANMSDGRWDESMEEHEAIMAALRKADGKALPALLAEHARLTGEAVIHALHERLRERSA